MAETIRCKDTLMEIIALGCIWMKDFVRGKKEMEMEKLQDPSVH